MAEFNVGDRVYTTHINEANRSRIPARITKVGRTLVTIVEDRYADWRTPGQQYRMDTRHINDQYGHSRFLTEAQVEEERTRAALTERAANTGYRLHGFAGWLDIPLDKLERIVAILEEKD